MASGDTRSKKFSINQKPLALGADVVMHSATKYLNGHSDVTAGVLAGSAAMMARIDPTRRLLGTVLIAGAWTLARLKTVGARRHNETRRPSPSVGQGRG
jgi:cystathionine beta-lyase/cystathionine gamma-synthase